MEADSSPFVLQLGWQDPLKLVADGRVGVRSHYVTAERTEQRKLRKSELNTYYGETLGRHQNQKLPKRLFSVRKRFISRVQRPGL